MRFWEMLWRKPKWAYNLGGLFLFGGFFVGWLAMRSQAGVTTEFVVIVAFCFATWALLTSVGATATYAGVLEQRLRDRN